MNGYCVFDSRTLGQLISESLITAITFPPSSDMRPLLLERSVNLLLTMAMYQPYVRELAEMKLYDDDSILATSTPSILTWHVRAHPRMDPLPSCMYEFVITIGAKSEMKKTVSEIKPEIRELEILTPPSLVMIPPSVAYCLEKVQSEIV
mmetsp:Transcript_3605/g.5550  ORF Transcript_3605/g.5550 Transcript_3605/m.5550 type:complete len:149 (-) Transcript_3605:1133-1579(-)